MGVAECINPPICGSHWWVIHTQVHWWISYIKAVHYVCGIPFQISGNASAIHILFMSIHYTFFRNGCSSKTFNGWLPLNVFAGWLCPTCVTGTWVPSWIDVIPIWYHYIVICTLAKTFNWWLSSKDMKLRVLIKEVLVIFHWLTFPIILLCSLASMYRALFLVQETTQELLLIIIINY